MCRKCIKKNLNSHFRNIHVAICVSRKPDEKKKSPKKAALLIKNGAKAQRNSDDTLPAIADVITTLILSDKEEDKELFDQMIALPTISDFFNFQANLKPSGIQHVIEAPQLVLLLKNWSDAISVEKEGAEQKINALFDQDHKLIFVPTFGMEQEEKEGLGRNMRKWNRDHTMKGEEGEL